MAAGALSVWTGLTGMVGILRSRCAHVGRVAAKSAECLYSIGKFCTIGGDSIGFVKEHYKAYEEEK